MKNNSTLLKIKKFVEDLMFPEDIKCIFCNRDINNFDERPYCDTCAKELPLNSGNRCKICDVPIKNEATICNLCQNTKIYFHKAYCPFQYSKQVRTRILSFKSDNCLYLAKHFARLIVEYMGEDIKGFDLITYVPMTDKKKKKRGYNQAEILASEISKLANIKLEETLLKNQETVSQKELNFEERMKNLEKCFVLKDKSTIKDKNILLVDDIITTTATVNSCAMKLAKYANKVSVCAIARTILKS